MSVRSIVMSSGHGLYVRGASGIIDEVDQARTLVERLAQEFRIQGIDCKTYHDDVSYTQQENLSRIVQFHNDHIRDLDISVHFNAYEQVDHPMGVEVLHLTQSTLASKVSNAIACAGGLIDRGGKQRTDLYFLNNTSGPAILLEICFVDSVADCELYRDHFEAIVFAIANVADKVESEETVPDDIYVVAGMASCFGGPDDEGVDPDEGLAFIDCVDDAPQLFLPFQPEGTTGLARRLNPYVHYIACRWDYEKMPKAELLNHVALVKARKTGVQLTAFPADWGPHGDTNRVADLSPGLLADLGIFTDDEVEVIFPYKPED